MDFIASTGFDVWLVDLPGYGRSTRPPEMSEPPEKNPPLVRTDAAVRAVSSAVGFILQKRGVAKLDLMGWSRGTSIMGSFAAANPDKVERLVLYAPQWVPSTPALISGQGAYRTVSIQATRDRWLKGVAEDKKKDLIPAGWFEQWADATFATDPVGSQTNPRTLRAPNGVIADIKEFWAEGKPLYDRADPRAHAAGTRGMGPGSADVHGEGRSSRSWSNARWKRFVEIGEGTHTVIMEKNRMELFREVQLFLEEPVPDLCYNAAIPAPIHPTDPEGPPRSIAAPLHRAALHAVIKLDGGRPPEVREGLSALPRTTSAGAT